MNCKGCTHFFDTLRELLNWTFDKAVMERG